VVPTVEEEWDGGGRGGGSVDSVAWKKVWEILAP
jgi:hypothetical protein